jgi:hypothetical protein
VKEEFMNSFKAWKVPASLVVLVLIGVLIAVHGRAIERQPLESVPAAEAAPARESEPPSNEVSEPPQLG